MFEPFVALKAKGYKPSHFWQSYADVASMILPREAVERLNKVPKGVSWTTESQSVHAVVNSSQLGRKWWGFAQMEVLSDELGGMITQMYMDAFGDKKHLTSSLVTATRALVEQKRF